MANPYAGEVALVIDGTRHVLKLTLGALAELEAGLEADSLVALIKRFEDGGFSSRDVLALIVAGLRGGGWSGTAEDLLSADIEGGPVTKAMRSAVVDGDSLSDSLRNLANSMVNSVFNAAVRPVTNQVGGLISDGIGALVGNLLPFEKGGSFAQGRVQPFANGGVIGGPTTFPMRGGMGLMGEAGPEAIMPLARGADGKLGVRGGGGQPISVVMNVSTPDVEGFRRSQAQIAAQLGRVMGHA